MKCLDKFRLFILSVCSSFLLLGCAATVNAPSNFYLNGSLVKPEPEIIKEPAIGEISTADLGDSLVSKHLYTATKGFTLKEDHIITNSGEKREELRAHCWLSKLPAGHYIAYYENSKYTFYTNTPVPGSGENSILNCDNGGKALIGFAQSKKSKNEYRPWYYVMWNINNDKATIEKYS